MPGSALSVFVVGPSGWDFGGVGQPELAAGPLVERGAAQPDDVGGAGARPKFHPVPRFHVSGDLPVDLHGEPPAAGQDVQRQAVLDREHQAAVVGRMRCGRGDQQRLDRRADDRPSLSSMADSAPASSGTSTSARKPSLPRFTPSTGARCRSASRSARSFSSSS